MSENILSTDLAPSGSDRVGDVSRSDAPIPHAHFSWWALITIAFVFLAGFSGFLFYQNQALRAKLVANPTPTPLSSPVSTPDPTEDWKTYTDSTHNYTISYPLSWKEESNPNVAQTNLTSGGMSVSITWSQHAGDEGNAGGCLSTCNFTGPDGSYNWTQLKQESYIKDNTGLIIRANIRDDNSVNRSLIDQILSTFKFTEGDNLEKKIGYIKAIRPNYDVYAIDVDYINFIDDKAAPNGFRIDNPSTSITTLQTDFTSDISPLVTTQSNKVKTFSELVRAFDEEPEKWRGIPFWIETKKGPVMKITEQYIP